MKPNDINGLWDDGYLLTPQSPTESNKNLLAYKNYIEANLERIERGGWTPVCFAEFLSSEECETYGGE